MASRGTGSRERLLQLAEAGARDSVDVLDLVLQAAATTRPDVALAVEVCAIPESMDSEACLLLLQSAGVADAEGALADVARFHFVLKDRDDQAPRLHQSVREPLLERWHRAERVSEYRRLSRLLYELYEGRFVESLRDRRRLSDLSRPIKRGGRHRYTQLFRIIEHSTVQHLAAAIDHAALSGRSDLSGLLDRCLARIGQDVRLARIALMTLDRHLTAERPTPQIHPVAYARGVRQEPSSASWQYAIALSRVELATIAGTSSPQEASAAVRRLIEQPAPTTGLEDRALWVLYDLLVELDDFPGLATLLNERRRIANAAPDSPGASRALADVELNAGRLERLLQNPVRAEPHYNRARRLGRALGDVTIEVRGLLGVAQALKDQGEGDLAFGAALDCLVDLRVGRGPRQGRPVWSQEGDSQRVAVRTLLALCSAPAAVPLVPALRAELVLLERQPEESPTAGRLGCAYAQALRRCGDYEGARAVLGRLMGIHPLDGSSLTFELLVLRAQLASVQPDLGDPVAAFSAALDFLVANRPSSRWDLGATLVNRSIRLLRNNAYEDAARDLDEAERIWGEIGHERHLGLVAAYKSLCNLGVGGLPAAKRYFGEADTYLGRLPGRYAADLARVDGSIMLVDGNLESAEQAFRDALGHRLAHGEWEEVPYDVALLRTVIGDAPVGQASSNVLALAESSLSALGAADGYTCRRTSQPADAAVAWATVGLAPDTFDPEFGVRRALNMIEGALASSGEAPWALLNAALAHWRLGEPDNARAYLPTLQRAPGPFPKTWLDRQFVKLHAEG